MKSPAPATDPTALATVPLALATVPLTATATRSTSLAASRVRRLNLGVLLSLAIGVLPTMGCNDDAELVRKIQADRQNRVQQQSRQDHLGEVDALLSQWVELNRDKAAQQVTYHLNQWRREQDSVDPAAPAELPAMLQTWSGLIPLDRLNEELSGEEYQPSDIEVLRDSYLFRKVATWAEASGGGDPLWADWLTQLSGPTPEQDSDSEPMKDDAAAKLKAAATLFDWTVRNIALEPPMPGTPPFPTPQYPLGMRFEGPGYRQLPFQTLYRGRGDALQRASVFGELCLQAGITTALLAKQTDDGQWIPWCIGVLVDDEVYLFEPNLGLPIPGPDQIGIATLTQARKDPSVMRRLNVAGYYEYPLSRTDIQQNVALLMVQPERLAPRMKRLENGLTGDRRMTLAVDVDGLNPRWDAAAGIAGVRLWEVPILAKVYRAESERFAVRDPDFSTWYYSRWAILESQSDTPTELAKGRWQHLTGQFADDDDEGRKGARSIYLEYRAPEFEIEDLELNVELQKQYGVRRELGMSSAEFQSRLTQVQDYMRLGKRTATYWLSLVQYDDGRFETAGNWFGKRVLDREQASMWNDAATYNFARCEEAIGNLESAIELLKDDRTPAAHGNRLRARLIDKQTDEDEPQP